MLVDGCPRSLRTRLPDAKTLVSPPRPFFVIVLNIDADLHQFRAHGSFDDAAELAQLAGLILKIVPRMGSFAEQGHSAHKGQIEAAKAKRLPGVAAFVCQDLAGTGNG